MTWPKRRKQKKPFVSIPAKAARQIDARGAKRNHDIARFVMVRELLLKNASTAWDIVARNASGAAM